MALIEKIRSKLTEFGKLTPLALVTTFLPMLGSFVLVLVGYPLGIWLRENWQVGSVGFAVGVIIFCGLALIPTNLIGILAGWSFGFAFGLLLLMIGITGAAYISFLIHRRITGSHLPDIAEKYPKAQAIYDELVRDNEVRATVVILLIRCSIIMPFAFTNFLLASARVSSVSFLIGTTFGMLPRSAAMVFTGAGLLTLTLETGMQTWAIVLGIAASILMIIVISYLSRRALIKMTERATEAAAG